MKKLASLIIALLSVAAQAGAQKYFGILGTEGLEMMSALKYGKIDFENGICLTEGYYRLSYENKYQPDYTNVLRKAYVAGGACYHDGLIYSNEYYDLDRVDKEKPMWRIYDAKTMNLVSEHELPDFCRATTTGLTYDITEDAIYGFDVTYTETYLVRVDPATGEMTRIGDFLDRNCKYLALACRKDGTLFCIYMDKTTSNHYLARIRKSDARIATLGVLSSGGYMDGDGFVNGGYLQCMWFCNANDKLYWLHQSASLQFAHEDYTPVMEIDIEKTHATMVAYYPIHLLTGGTFFLEPKFTAPAAIQDLTFITSETANSSGALQVVAPTTDYLGRPLTGRLTICLVDSEDGSEIATLEAEPGATVKTDEMSFVQGDVKLTAYAVNANGEEGLRIKRSFYAGYDQPKAPSNIVLTATDLTTTLTWDAPTDGVHGYAIDTESLTYTVVRYPGEITVAKGIRERTFTEEHPADMTRYVYAVYATDGTGQKGKSAYSNNLIVGSPLTVPYGGAFTDASDLFNFFTIIDANADSKTWTYDTNSQQAVYIYNPEKAADDWLISPPIIYEAGKRYKVTFTACSSMQDYPEAFEVHYGTGRTPTELSKTLLAVSSVPTDITEYSVKLPAAQNTGVYYFAIRCVSAAYHEFLYLNNIRVQEATDDDDDPTGSASDIVGDYVVLNYMTYESDNALYLKDMRNFSIEVDPSEENGILLNNFYIRQAAPTKASYQPAERNIAIAAGTPVFEFNDGSGSAQYLYPWDDTASAPTTQDILYQPVADAWVCPTHTVLMVGAEGDELTPYEFAVCSMICPANATVESNSFVYNYNYYTQQVEVEAEYNEKLPAFVTFSGNKFNIYNLHTTDSYGYGCQLQLTYDPVTGSVSSGPSICGEVQTNTEYPYKALAGTSFDFSTNLPVGAYKPGTSQEGLITGTADLEKGIIALNPLSIYPVSYDYNTGRLAVYYESVYETIKYLTIHFDLSSADGIQAPTPDAATGAAGAVRYFSLSGQQLQRPMPGQFVIRQTTYADGTVKSEKMVK
ncbi:MAG: hypothetical protein HUK04_00810 [Bacteroidaceae bacterium]|nr:hypothetical protein [Bacteroidaceae bacterium]